MNYSILGVGFIALIIGVLIFGTVASVALGVIRHFVSYDTFFLGDFNAAGKLWILRAACFIVTALWLGLWAAETAFFQVMSLWAIVSTL
jgi:hypothetical protein